LNIVLEWLHKMTHIKNVSKITAPRKIKFQSKLQYKENNLYGSSVILPFENSHN
jgi:hypothetical protein